MSPACHQLSPVPLLSAPRSCLLSNAVPVSGSWAPRSIRLPFCAFFPQNALRALTARGHELRFLLVAHRELGGRGFAVPVDRSWLWSPRFGSSAASPYAPQSVPGRDQPWRCLEQPQGSARAPRSSSALNDPAYRTGEISPHKMAFIPSFHPTQPVSKRRQGQLHRDRRGQGRRQ